MGVPPAVLQEGLRVRNHALLKLGRHNGDQNGCPTIKHQVGWTCDTNTLRPKPKTRAHVTMDRIKANAGRVRVSRTAGNHLIEAELATTTIETTYLSAFLLCTPRFAGTAMAVATHCMNRIQNGSR